MCTTGMKAILKERAVYSDTMRWENGYILRIQSIVIWIMPQALRRGILYSREKEKEEKFVKLMLKHAQGTFIILAL